MKRLNRRRGPVTLLGWAVLLGLIALAGTPIGPAGPPAQAAPAAEHMVYLPVVSQTLECSMSSQAATLARLLRDHPEQGRPAFTCHSVLVEVAARHAQNMASQNFFGHIDLQGYGPNMRVEQAGYVLPTWYGHELTSNNIESIAGGYPTAESALQAWLDSAGHRQHVLGLDPYWAEQVEFGIGFAYNPSSTYHYYWVLVSARPGP